MGDRAYTSESAVNVVSHISPLQVAGRMPYARHPIWCEKYELYLIFSGRLRQFLGYLKGQEISNPPGLRYHMNPDAVNIPWFAERTGRLATLWEATRDIFAAPPRAQTTRKCSTRWTTFGWP